MTLGKRLTKIILSNIIGNFVFNVNRFFQTIGTFCSAVLFYPFYVSSEESSIAASAEFPRQQKLKLNYKIASRQVQFSNDLLKTNLQTCNLLFFSSDYKGIHFLQIGIYIGDNQFQALSTSVAVEHSTV